MALRKKRLVISIIGIDGSGKTTICDCLLSKFEPSEARHIWLGAESVLMRPIRAALGLALRRTSKRQSAKSSYESRLAAKQKFSTRLRWLQPVYVWFVVADYRLQYRFKCFLNRRIFTLVCDRYFFDVAVNLAVTLQWTEDELGTFLQRYCHLFQLPHVRCLIQVPIDIAMTRKDDVPDVGYLKSRTAYYERIAHDFGFTVLDGTSAIEVTAQHIYSLALQAQDSQHVHYVHSNNIDIGGADFCLHRMALAVRNSGIMTSASLRLRTSIVSRYEVSGIPTSIYPFVRPQLSQGLHSLLLLPLRGLVALHYFFRLFRSFRPDIVHVNDLYDIFPAFAARCCGIPVVYHLRMIRKHASERRIFGFVVARLSHVSISVSDSVRKSYFLDYRPRRHKALVVHDWPDDRLVKLADSKCPQVFQRVPIRTVMIGRLDDWKGQHIFVEAVSRLGNRAANVGFFLVGGRTSGPDKSRYADRVLKAAAETGVTYLGERDDVPTLLRWADVSVHASTLPDPFPGTVLESLLAETATIASDSGGVVEMIHTGVHGILVPPGDAEAMTDALSVLLNDREYRMKLARAGREHILAITDKTSLVARLIDIYSNV